MPSFVEKGNLLLYGVRDCVLPSGAVWGAEFEIEPGPDFAAALTDFAVRFVPVPPDRMFFRRLCIHEAVSNALKYGQAGLYLSARGDNEHTEVSLRQNARIIWPEKTQDFRGTALIKRYAGDIRFSFDKRKIYLLFY